MSIETSEIVSELSRSIRSGLIELHNQTINDVQGIVASTEVRLSGQLAMLEARLSALEQLVRGGGCD